MERKVGEKKVKEPSKKRQSDRSYVAEAFDFEKLAIIFIINILFPNFKLNNVTYIKMGKQNPAGDIDTSLLVHPNKLLHFQIKSNKNLENITTTGIVKGLDQLYSAFYGTESNGITESVYLLAYEGYSNLKEAKQLFLRRSPDTTTTNFWMENLTKDDNKSTGSILQFLDRTSIIFLPSREHMKIMLERIFTLDELRYLTGHLTYDREMKDRRTLRLLHRGFPFEKEPKKDEKFLKKIVKHIEDEHLRQFRYKQEKEWGSGFEEVYSSKWMTIIFILLDEKIFDGHAKIAENFASELKATLEEKGTLKTSPFAIKELRHSLKFLPLQKDHQKDFYHDDIFKFEISSNELEIAIPKFYYSKFHHSTTKYSQKTDFYTHHFPMEDFKKLIHCALNVLQVIYATFEIEQDYSCLILGGSFEGIQYSEKLYDGDIRIYINKQYTKNEILSMSLEKEVLYYQNEIAKSFQKDLCDKQFHNEDDEEGLGDEDDE